MSTEILPAAGRRVNKPRTGKNADNGHDYIEDGHWLSKLIQARVDDEWWNSRACRLLKPGKSHSGLWIPDWLTAITTNPNDRRLMAWILFLFDDKSTRSAAIGRNRLQQSDGDSIRNMPAKGVRRKKPMCRTQACYKHSMPVTGTTQETTIETDVRVLIAPLKRLAAAIGVTEKACRGSLKRLTASRLIFRFDKPGDEGIILCPNGHALACAFLKEVYPREDHPEAKVDLVYGWYESIYRHRAMNRDGRIHFDLLDFSDESIRSGTFKGLKEIRVPVPRGTWVDDALYIACDRNAGAAEIAADLSWSCGYRNKKTGKPLATTVFDGKRWVYRSVRQIAERLNYPFHSVHHWLKWLTAAGEHHFFHVAMKPVRRLNIGPQGVSHFSPDSLAIYKAIKDRKAEIAELREGRFWNSKHSRIARSEREEEDREHEFVPTTVEEQALSLSRKEHFERLDQEEAVEWYKAFKSRVDATR